VNSCWDYFHNNNHNFDHLSTDKINKYIVEIIAFIKKPLTVELIITNNPHLEERNNYPLDAIREIVINTLVQRDYRDSNGSIIKINDDKIEFYNLEGLYGDITEQELLKFNYQPQAQNKLIAKAFKEIGKVERYDSGLK
jgi:ATP-dependent DNA helicase RecG